MLLNDLRNTNKLQNFLRDSCAENEVGVSFDPSVSAADFVVIKVDDYLKTIHPNPAGNDCLIVQKCTDNNYKLYLIELKNIKELRGLEHIRQKFQNCFDTLMSDHFRDLFYDRDYSFSAIQLYFVSNLKKDKKQKNTKLDALLTLRPCHFAGRKYAIYASEPYPMIVKC